MKQESVGILTLMSLTVVYCCVFPRYLTDTTWHKNIQSSIRTIINFHDNVIEFQLENTKLNYISSEWEDKCYQMIDVDKYIVIHENNTYSCIEFIKRGNSVIQIKLSRTSDKFSTMLCEDRQIKLDPILLVSFDMSKKDFQDCPFTGGYNMKLTAKDGSEHPCNSMELPMRFESECHKGEGITFDFRKDHCVGNIPVSVLQKVICVTSWREGGDVLTILRAPDTNRLLCLRIPARSSFDSKTVMLLYTDPTCNENSDNQYYSLELELINQYSLCLDEHNSCNKLPCYDSFTSQCLRSCGQCDPNVYQTICDYPRKIRGEWLINDVHGRNIVNISGSQLHYDRVGSFTCVTFPDSPPSRKMKQFTTVSFFSNGCRPRYTCVAFKRMRSNIYGFAISQSKVWPLQNGHANVWSEICSTNNFYGDPKPVGDTFRTYNDVFKPMMTKTNTISGITCPLSSSYLLNATFQTGGTCSGHLFKVCKKQSHIHIQYDNCPMVSKKFEEFKCISMIDGKYWEKIILLQRNDEKNDTVCIILSDLEPGRILMLPSGECDQFTWTYVNVGLRKPSLDMIVTPEIQSCRPVEATTPSVILPKTSTSQTYNELLKDAFKSRNSTENATRHKHRHQNHKTSTPSFQYKDVETIVSSSTTKLYLSSSYLYTIYIFSVIFCMCCREINI